MLVVRKDDSGAGQCAVAGPALPAINDDEPFVVPGCGVGMVGRVGTERRPDGRYCIELRTRLLVYHDKPVLTVAGAVCEAPGIGAEAEALVSNDIVGCLRLTVKNDQPLLILEHNAGIF